MLAPPVSGWRSISCSNAAVTGRTSRIRRWLMRDSAAIKRHASTQELEGEIPRFQIRRLLRSAPDDSRPSPFARNDREARPASQPITHDAIQLRTGSATRRFSRTGDGPKPWRTGPLKAARPRNWQLQALEEDPSPTMRRMVETTLQEMLLKVDLPEFHAITGLRPETAAEVFHDFEQSLKRRMDAWPVDPTRDPVFQRLWNARTISNRKMNELLKFWLQHHVVTRKLADRPVVSQRMRELLDLREPFEWYTQTRQIQRKFHLHIGPTNSGKTYHALQRLEKAKTGLFAGPLRLLAHEVYHRMNAAGRACTLITGDERLDSKVKAERNQPLISCTVEMTPLEKEFDVAVIDEIQMLGDSYRGFAWTKALLGLKAHEIHLCGEERTRWLVEKIVRGLGDELEVHEYERLSPLQVQNTALEGKWDRLRTGDCLVAFEVPLLHALRKDIEAQTKKKVAIVYGSLPPETRAQQAALFNDPSSGVDILVASDAIGMGLNLNIKRIIFYRTSKMMGPIHEPLEASQIKQIAGRAGRFKVAPSSSAEPADLHPEDVEPVTEARSSLPRNPGLVTALMKSDLERVQKAMKGSVPNITKAGIFPPDDIFFQFASHLPPDTPFSYTLLRCYTTTQTHPLFIVGLEQNAVATSDALQSVAGLGLQDRMSFVNAPMDVNKPEMLPVILELARRIGDNRPAPILDLPGLKLELLDHNGPASLNYLKELELLHKSLVLYNWLSYRYEILLHTRATAGHIKSLVEKRIDQTLSELGAAFQHKLKRDMRKRERGIERQGKQEIVQGDAALIEPEVASISSAQDQRPHIDELASDALSSFELPPHFSHTSVSVHSG